MPALDTGTLSPDRCLDTNTELCRLPDPDIQVIRDGPARAAQALILAHGAGQGSDSPFLQWFSVELARARLPGGLSITSGDFDGDGLGDLAIGDDLGVYFYNSVPVLR